MKHPATETSEPARGAPSRADVAWARLRQIGPRARRLLREPSRAALTNGAALLGILVLSAVDASGMVSFVCVVALAVVLWSGRERTKGEGTESNDTEPPPRQPS
jgi:hypothetical protein